MTPNGATAVSFHGWSPISNDANTREHTVVTNVPGRTVSKGRPVGLSVGGQTVHHDDPPDDRRSGRKGARVALDRPTETSRKQLMIHF